MAQAVCCRETGQGEVVFRQNGKSKCFTWNIKGKDTQIWFERTKWLDGRRQSWRTSLHRKPVWRSESCSDGIHFPGPWEAATLWVSSKCLIDLQERPVTAAPASSNPVKMNAWRKFFCIVLRRESICPAVGFSPVFRWNTPENYSNRMDLRPIWTDGSFHRYRSELLFAVHVFKMYA